MPIALQKLCGRGKAAKALALTLGLALLAFSVLGLYLGLSTAPEADRWNTDFEVAGEYLVARPAYASKTIYTDSNGSYCLLFWWHESTGELICRVARGSRLDSALTDLQYYTYGVRDRVDQQVVVRGMTTALPAALQSAAIQEYNLLVSEGDAAADRFEEMFGTLCLDTDRAPVEWGSILFWGVVTLLLLAGIVWACARRGRVNRQNRRTLAAVPGLALGQAARELSGARSWKSMGLYLGQNYLYSTRTGLVLVDGRDVHAAGVLHGDDPEAAAAGGRPGRVSLWLEYENQPTASGPLPWFKATRQNTEALEEIASRLPGGCRVDEDGVNMTASAGWSQPAAFAGTTGTRAAAPVTPAAVQMSQIQQVHGPVYDANLRVQTAEDGDGNQPHLGRGLLGALLGCLIGGVAWVALGVFTQIISGWIGVLTIWLALTLYKKFAGGLDKRGAVISLVMALITVPAALFFTYAFSVMHESPGVGLADASRWVWRIIQSGDTPEVWVDLAIGLALTLLVGIPMFRNVVNPPKAVSGNIGQAVVDETGRVHMRPTAQNNVGCAITAGALIVLAVLMGIGTESLVIGMALLGLAVVCLVLYSSARRANRNSSISYDDAGLQWTDAAGRSHDCVWQQVTQLDFRNTGALRIRTLQGDVVFNRTWPGWYQLMQAAEQNAPGAQKIK